MHASINSAVRYAASALVFTLAMAQAAHAEPATKESLQRYFAIARFEHKNAAEVEAMLALDARQWQNEQDAAYKATLKARFERMAAITREYLGWNVIEPITIGSYQAVLQESEVQALIAEAQSPRGQVYIDKVGPALLKQPAAVAAHLARRVEEIRLRVLDNLPPAPAPPPAPATPKEALAQKLMLNWPGAREEFTSNMAGVEARAHDLFSTTENKDLADIAVEIRRYATALRTEITFEEVSAIEARMMAAELSEAEIAGLIEDQNDPARAAQRARLEQAEARLVEDMLASPQIVEMKKRLEKAYFAEYDTAPASAAPASKARPAKKIRSPARTGR
ncbi:hypothetical protein [Massilia sp. CCM 8734]|uniref:hypothetical protein n=1 Tax=Massilia sp. CCM 8734 TaxID=2609283 RepID=UPI00141F5484|nr:hypothetical protein [Massilia sp. CCM 8734]NHZ95113.1 hypothetical protein [Massilia sp. CCM 8734]